MNVELKELLNDAVVTPYDEYVAQQLAEVCDEIASELGINDINRHIKCFVYGKPNNELKEEIEQKYIEKYPKEDGFAMPPLFTIILAQYIVIEAFEKHLKGRDKAVCSLKLMNMMLLRKGSLSQLLLPEYISEMYNKLDDYIAQADKIPVNTEFKHLWEIMSDPTYLTNHIAEVELQNEIRMMAKVTYLHRQDMLVKNFSVQKYVSPFERMYYVLYEVIEHAEWLFPKYDVVKMIRNIAQEDEKKQQPIESIVKDLRNVGEKLPLDELDDSSILLKSIAGEDLAEELRQRRLNVVEFGVYIYYELMLEQILKRYYGRSE